LFAAAEGRGMVKDVILMSDLERGSAMFRVQRGTGDAWKTICSHASEAYARGVYERQLKVNSTGRFRLVDPQDKVLAEGTARRLFERSERDDEERPSTDYVAPAPPRPT
jgi:hypothetical protein